MGNDSSTMTISRRRPKAVAMTRRMVYDRLLAYLRMEQTGWLVAVLAVLTATLAGSLALRLIQPLLDVALPLAQAAQTQAQGLALVNYYLFFMVLFTLLSAALLGLGRALTARLAQLMVTRLRADYHKTLLRQSPTFFRQHDVGELTAVGMGDVEVVGTFFTQQVPFLLMNMGQLVLALVFMVQLSWPLTLLAVVLVGGLQAVSLLVVGPRIRKQSLAYREQYANVSSFLTENLSGLRDVQIYRQETRSEGRFWRRLQVMAQQMGRSMNLTMVNVSIFYLLSGLGIALIYGLGTQGVVRGLLDVGFMVSFAAFFSQFLSPVTALSSAWVQLQGMETALRRTLDLMNVPAEVSDRSSATDPGRVTGKIEFRQVSFSYEPDDPDEWRVHRVNLTIEPGEKVAFVGGSGTGKSTLVHLVARFHDVTTGAILLDGKDIRGMTLEGLRRNVALVSQKVMLFEGTIAENIKFGKRDATPEELAAAGAVGNVDAFLDQLENGYDTGLGPMGQGLSGGQAQRVSIARAAISDAPIMIFDEPTAALDNQSEAEVMRALDRLTVGRTTLIIAHRLQTILNSDKIVVLGVDEKGHGVVKAVGRHEELLDTSDDYGQLYLSRLKRQAVLMPIGALYNTLPILPTVVGLARSMEAPVFVLDFGTVSQDETESQARFGVAYEDVGQMFGKIVEVNAAHETRLVQLRKLLEEEGLTYTVIYPKGEIDWTDATVAAIFETGATHVVAMENVMIPLTELRERIRKIERKTQVDYILVDPMIRAE